MEGELKELLDLGVALGRNQAFGIVAGRCSAAQAEAIHRLRSEKRYKSVTEHWKEFCPEYLGMSGTQADHIIRLWEEFGSGYFDLSQLTRVSAETYRALEPAVENGVLHFNGEQIQLTVDNSRKVAAAVAQIRRNLPAPAGTPLAGRVERLEQLCEFLIEELRGVPDASAEIFGRYRIALRQLYAVLRNLREQFKF
jgi:hypothetical protein